jgi:hypothetical protein
MSPGDRSERDAPLFREGSFTLFNLFLGNSTLLCFRCFDIGRVSNFDGKIKAIFMTVKKKLNRKLHGKSGGEGVSTNYHSYFAAPGRKAEYIRKYNP